MLQYSTRRLIMLLPILFFVLLITFTLGFYGPGDPLTTFFGDDAFMADDPELINRLRRLHGLDRPFWVQFGDYITGYFKGDLGNSIIEKRPVLDMIKAGAPISAQLGLAATIVLVFVGIPLGVLCAVRQNTWIDYWIISFSISLRSIPVFVLAPLLLIILVLKLGVLKKTPIGWEGIFSQKVIIPVLLMAAGPMLGIVRMARSGVLEVIGQNYVRTARAKGMGERMVISKHIVKNAMTPVMTTLGLTMSGLITGALFVELIFGIPGVAGLGIWAFKRRDYPVILATTAMGSFLIIVANLLVDLGYGLLDPRVRYE